MARALTAILALALMPGGAATAAMAGSDDASAACSAGIVSACVEAWDEAKAGWAKAGVTPSLLYQGAVAAIAKGGVRQGATYIGNLHLQLELDGGPLVGVPGLTVYLDGLDIHGGQPSGFAGDAQQVSNLAAPPRFELYEAWAQYQFLDDRLSVLGGLYDLNTEFYRLQSAAPFLNGSFGIGPEFASSGIGGPSIFPNTSVGARFAAQPLPNLHWRTAVLDGAPVRRPDGATGIFKSGDGALVVSEISYLDVGARETTERKTGFRVGPNLDEAAYDGKIALGGWYYTARFPDLSEVDAAGQPVLHRGSGGGYVLADRVLYRAPGDEGGRLAGFVQAGIGDGRINRFGSYVGSGFIAAGFVPGRPADQVGAAVAVARNGAHYRSAQREQGTPVTGAEIALEVTYLAQIARWLVVQPDAQYVIHPNTDPALADALVFQLQFQITF